MHVQTSYLEKDSQVMLDDLRKIVSESTKQESVWQLTSVSSNVIRAYPFLDFSEIKRVGEYIAESYHNYPSMLPSKKTGSTEQAKSQFKELILGRLSGYFAQFLARLQQTKLNLGGIFFFKVLFLRITMPAIRSILAVVLRFFNFCFQLGLEDSSSFLLIRSLILGRYSRFMTACFF